MEALALFKREHRGIIHLFSQVERNFNNLEELKKHFIELKNLWNIHLEHENNSFLNRLDDHPDLLLIIKNVRYDHLTIRVLIKELEALPLGDTLWRQKFKILRDFTENYIKKEENSLFPAIEELLGEEKYKKVLREYKEFPSGGLGA